MREKYGLTEGAAIEFLDTGEGITVRSSEPFCKICRAKLADITKLPVCEACIEEIFKIHNK